MDKGGFFMVNCKIKIGIEEEKILADATLNHPKNVEMRKHKQILCIIMVVFSVMLLSVSIESKDELSGIVFSVFLLFFVLYGIGIRRYQRKLFISKMQKMDQVRPLQEREYSMDSQGIRIKSDMADSLHYWKSFEYYGEMEHYLFAIRKDYQIVLVDKNSLSPEETQEILDLFMEHIIHKMK
jgi:hypothetical protein